MANLKHQAVAVFIFLLIGCMSIEDVATAKPPGNWFQPQSISVPTEIAPGPVVKHIAPVSAPVIIKEDSDEEDTKKDDSVTIRPRRQLFIHGVSSSFLRSAGEEFKMQCVTQKEKVECFAADSNPLSVKIVK